MSEIRAEYPFQVSYKDRRLDDSLICLRAESAEQLGEYYVQCQAILDTVLGLPSEPQETAPPPPAAAPPDASSDSVAELPMEALRALMDQKKPMPCSCNAGWWDNRQSKKNPKAPDFKCKKDGTHAVWLKAFEG